MNIYGDISSATPWQIGVYNKSTLAAKGIEGTIPYNKQFYKISHMLMVYHNHNNKDFIIRW